MSPISLGSSPIIGCSLGSVQLSAVYQGAALIWQQLVGNFRLATVNRDAAVSSYRSSSHVSTAGAANGETVATPDGIAAGDLLVLYTVASAGTSASMVVPAGFTELNRVIGNPGARLVVSYKVASASEPTSYTYPAYPTASDGCSMMVCIKDWDGVTANLRSGISSATNTARTTPSVTPVTSRNLLLTSIAQDDDNEGWTWGWIPPAQAGAVGYAHNTPGYWSSTCVAQEQWNSSSATGTRTWSVNTSSTQTTYMTSALAIGSGTRSATITEFLADQAKTAGKGGELTDRIDLPFTDSAGTSSVYHLYAAGLDWTKSVGLMVYTDGSGEYGLLTDTINGPSEYLLDGPNGLIAVAKRQNMVLLTPRAPGNGCRDGDGVCWYDHSYNGTTPWQKLEWSNELIRKVLTEYDIDRRRIAIGGFSSGAQWTMSWWGPKYGPEVMLDGVAVGISYGGQPRVTPRLTDAYKQNVEHVWDTGTLDTAYSEPTWDDGVQTGMAWYRSNGFAVTDLVLQQGKGHDHDVVVGGVETSDFGQIMEREILARVMRADGTMPPKIQSAFLRDTTGQLTVAATANKAIEAPTSQEGDAVLMTLTFYGSGSANGRLPSGFREMGRVERSASHSMMVGYKVATANEPANYTATVPTGCAFAVDLVSFGNVDVAKIVDATVVVNPAGPNQTIPSITPPTNHGVYYGAVSGGNGALWQLPAGMTQSVNLATGSPTYLTLAAAWELRTDKSATGTRTFVDSGNTFTHAAMSIFLPSKGSS